MSKKTATAVPSRVPEKASTFSFGMELDLRLDKNDLVNIAVSQAEEKLVLDREQQEAALREATRQHEKTVEKLATLAQTQLDSFTLDDDTRNLLQLLQRKTGHAYIVKIVNMNASLYGSYGRKDKDDAPEVDVKKLAIVGSARVHKKRGDDNYSSSELSWEVSIPFSDEMKAVVDDIKDCADTVQKAKDDLAATNRMICDIPRLRNRALRELTLAVARGEVKTMADATDVVMGTQSKALPGSVGMLPSPSTGGHNDDDDC